ncbi:MAG: pantoate--beta-alanine ligase [Deltaproteobacteria bacterium CG12_big_fil_rev_8_21_14_0_65_43_10]|nr:MAG: pantoate--beta-alanine ligase [Deltaproteobacteria bacterium CG2_30_43_15]PIQ44469.1 MAG: pantoate--beta-alanine ligase [Deltaproteobacteria bacterium CG12_big_fil_rev_8_21_14_0_65_43_10]PIU86659.1 MAG: pantoate--beta-alanine ligase [Deltaproteobacteria bacterium CG06_land_8_20_14_3_00_44_19]PIX26296.1 MAG: pantoate--beta-alanine ligase [Deltaproteobacteria bacterium CG_4_8_14_3_um_filter_43_13]PIZ19943.1 MAG: pantoate--beta-alanine ligase [Deltaproteobacteria bacterium CG_4_10_14_0_8_u
MKTLSSVKEMQEFAEDSRLSGKTIALVPTMGFLHQGHLELMEEGKKRADILIISIFVNPTQFGVGEDLEKYPRDMERDKKLAEGVGVDIIFAPSASEMYPKGYQTYVNVKDVTRNLCGISRPTHFRGVTTVVAKLFNIVKPHIAIFGEKDFQQLVTIRQMVKDLNFDIEIVGIPTVREKDGLAMSSRNTYLTPEERKAALSLNQAISIARDIFRSGERRSESILREVKKRIESEDLTDIDYVKMCDSQTLEDIEEIDRGAVLAIAVKVGRTRLIDNCTFERGE